MEQLKRGTHPNQHLYDAKRRDRQFSVRLPESLSLRLREYALEKHSNENQALIHIIKTFFTTHK